MTFSDDEIAACRTLVELALREDLAEAGDITSTALIPADLPGRAVFVARKPGVLAGLPAVPLVLEQFPGVKFEALCQDGDHLLPGKNDRIAVMSGSMRSILTAERTALNFLQRLSGVATQTARYVELLAKAGLKAQVLDTRKTTPGWRLLEKYAVRAGGGHNHRIGLYDGILIKDNHLAELPQPDRFQQIEDALSRAFAAHPDMPIEIEVESLPQFWVALDRRTARSLRRRESRYNLRHRPHRRRAH
jgi:nicotinate-nucleotide pyrophosphorylase (carboxylating)